MRWPVQSPATTIQSAAICQIIIAPFSSTTQETVFWSDISDFFFYFVQKVSLTAPYFSWSTFVSPSAHILHTSPPTASSRRSAVCRRAAARGCSSGSSARARDWPCSRPPIWCARICDWWPRRRRILSPRSTCEMRVMARVKKGVRVRGKSPHRVYPENNLIGLLREKEGVCVCE